MEILVYFIPVFFVGVFVLVTFIISRFAWARLATHYPAGDRFIGTESSIISLTINWISYNNCVILKHNEEGLYLKPIFFIRLFHKPLFIPWKEIMAVRDKRLHFFAYKELQIGSPIVSTIGIRKRTFAKMENTWKYHTGRNT